MSHTKGPWSFKNCSIMANDKKHVIAEVNPEASNEKWLYDCYLIATAPEMINALEPLLLAYKTCLKELNETDESIEVIEAIIKKAKGL